jgi:SAM-dependent methyltransferase
MHPTAMSNCNQFFKTYSDHFARNKSTRVIEIGSQDVNGSLRETCPPEFEYIGVDFVDGKGVDIVLEDPYVLPFESASSDIILSSSCFEHSEMFWLSFLEIMRVLKPGGLFYLNVPSNGSFHRYPVDCWRFYPDSGNALVSWAKRNGYNPTLLESYISNQYLDQWNDFVAVFLKDVSQISNYNNRIIDRFTDFKNGIKHGESQLIQPANTPEDRLKLILISQITNNQVKLK